MDATPLPTLQVFDRAASTKPTEVASGPKMRMFDWLLFKPQAHAIQPFPVNESARPEKKPQ